MIFRQLIDYDTHTFTYFVACKSTREGLIIDPVIGQLPLYLSLLKELDVRLLYALDTHVHADHITALGKLEESTGCTTILGEQTQAQCVSKKIKEGEQIQLGDLTLIAHYTPGHTDDSYSYQIGSLLFTGDTLLIRSTGRTDFQNGSAADQYDSIFHKLLTFPDETLVYPAHDYKGYTSSTIGEEKRFNPRLQVKNKAAYIEQMNNLNLAHPKYMDVAVPANLTCGKQDS